MNQARTQQSVIWLGMRLAVPAEWEIVRHAVSPKQGGLSMIDRRDQRLQLSWRELRAAPDLGRMLDDYRSRDAELYPAGKVVGVENAGGWRALRRSAEKGCLTRAVRYEPAYGRLIELVLPWPGGTAAPGGTVAPVAVEGGAGRYDERVERAILESFSMAADPLGPQRWCAWGLDCTAPAGWPLGRAQVKPADVSLVFQHEKERLTARRLGAPDLWYHDRPEEFLEQELDGQPNEIQFMRHRGHQACHSKSQEKTQPYRRLAGLGLEREDLVWHCPLDHVVYQVTAHYRRRKPVSLRDLDVRCCASRVAEGQAA
ncbi:MAG: hypothetical protein WD042_07355 [Phycisphaeraceae bacterium]